MSTQINRIFIVDDDFVFRKILTSFFEEKGWLVTCSSDGLNLINRINEFMPDVILLDIRMPNRDGISTCRIIKNDKSLNRLYPVVMMTSVSDASNVSKAIEAGCDDYIIKPNSLKELEGQILQKIENVLNMFMRNNTSNFSNKKDGHAESKEEAEIIRYSKEVINDVFESIKSGGLFNQEAVQLLTNKMVSILKKEHTLPIAFKIKTYNDYTYVHSVNVATISLSFAFHLGWEEEDLRILGEGALLHDVGKTSIDITILNKPELLTNDECEVMKRHTALGKDILIAQGVGRSSINIAADHHERVDGSGYPCHLKANQTDKFSQLCAIVDVYDALTTDRCYRSGMESLHALKIMDKEKEKYNPLMFDTFSNLLTQDIIGKG